MSCIKIDQILVKLCIDVRNSRIWQNLSVFRVISTHDKCAPVLLNLLNSQRKRDKMLGKPCILSIFPNLFNKSNKV